MFFKKKNKKEEKKIYTSEETAKILDDAAVDPDGIDDDETLGEPDSSVRIEDIINDEGK